jgi:hypothetical protein
VSSISGAALGPVDIKEVTSICLTAKAGDIIYVKSGSYSNVGSVSITCKAGSALAPVIIRPALQDSVTYAGTMNLDFAGNYLTFDGFQFIGVKPG